MIFGCLTHLINKLVRVEQIFGKREALNFGMKGLEAIVIGNDLLNGCQNADFIESVLFLFFTEIAQVDLSQ